MKTDASRLLRQEASNGYGPTPRNGVTGALDSDMRLAVGMIPHRMAERTRLHRAYVRALCTLL